MRATVNTTEPAEQVLEDAPGKTDGSGTNLTDSRLESCGSHPGGLFTSEHGKGAFAEEVRQRRNGLKSGEWGLRRGLSTHRGRRTEQGQDMEERENCFDPRTPAASAQDANTPRPTGGEVAVQVNALLPADAGLPPAPRKHHDPTPWMPEPTCSAPRERMYVFVMDTIDHAPLCTQNTLWTLAASEECGYWIKITCRRNCLIKSDSKLHGTLRPLTPCPEPVTLRRPQAGCALNTHPSAKG